MQREPVPSCPSPCGRGLGFKRGAWDGFAYRNRSLHPRGVCTPCIGLGIGGIGKACIGVSSRARAQAS